jgi:hypothetical protein
MKKTLSALALLAMTFPLFAAAPASYAGKWTYDAAASKDMPPMFAGVKLWTLDVTQDAKQLTTRVHIENDRMPTFDQTFVYALDGTETKTETAIMTPDGPKQVPTTPQANVADGGALRLTIARELPMNGETIHGVVTEQWSLSADGKTLTIHRHDDGPRKGDMDIVFRR